MLQVENISFRYGRKKEWVLRNLSFSLHRKERVGIIAPSGYGKSTLAKIIAGLYPPTSGEVFISDQKSTKNDFNPIQLIHQHPEQAVNPRWSIHRILNETGQQLPEVISTLGIEEEWLNRFPRELSGGQLQRCCIARSLAPETEFLIADEISTMLDTVTQAQLWDHILSEVERRDIGLIVISHNNQLLQQICTRQIDLREINQVGGD